MWDHEGRTFQAAGAASAKTLRQKSALCIPGYQTGQIGQQEVREGCKKETQTGGRGYGSHCESSSSNSERDRSHRKILGL